MHLSFTLVQHDCILFARASTELSSTSRTWLCNTQFFPTFSFPRRPLLCHAPLIITLAAMLSSTTSVSDHMAATRHTSTIGQPSSRYGVVRSPSPPCLAHTRSLSLPPAMLTTHQLMVLLLASLALHSYASAFDDDRLPTATNSHGSASHVVVSLITRVPTAHSTPFSHTFIIN